MSAFNNTGMANMHGFFEIANGNAVKVRRMVEWLELEEPHNFKLGSLKY